MMFCIWSIGPSSFSGRKALLCLDSILQRLEPHGGLEPRSLTGTGSPLGSGKTGTGLSDPIVTREQKLSRCKGPLASLSGLTGIPTRFERSVYFVLPCVSPLFVVGVR